MRTNTGLRLPISRTPAPSVDSLTRPDGPVGNGWIDGHAWDPSAYEPLGIKDGSIVCTDPRARLAYNPDKIYSADQINGAHPPPANEMHQGIGCVWREMETRKIKVRALWSGQWATMAGHHAEASPLLHVTPGTEMHGVGVWTSTFSMNEFVSEFPLLLYGTLGNPAEAFDTPYNAAFPGGHTDGTPRWIEMRSDGEATTVWMSHLATGIMTQASFSGGQGLTPIPIPVELKMSTLHGVAIDTHFCFPHEEIPDIPVIGKVVMSPE